jgi:tetratricopeptide (TPR) repeat protein
MDPTTLLTALVVAIGLLGADAVMYPDSVVVEVAPPPKLDSLSIDKSTLEADFAGRLDEILSTVSVVRSIDIRPSSDVGVGMALAEAAGVQNVAYALQSAIGYKPDRLRLALFTEDGKLRALVSGYDHVHTADGSLGGWVSGGQQGNDFRTVMVPNKDEKLLDFVRRCSLWGASQLAPYSTTLYLLEQHAADKDFGDVIALTEHVKAQLPPTPHNAERALFDNVLGLVALFHNDKQGARDAFDRAMRSDPTNPVPFLNAAFTDLQFDDDQQALDRMEQLIQVAPPAKSGLLATAYMTEGAALMALKNLKRANEMFAKAIQIAPNSATVLGLWAEEKTLEGDKVEAARLRQRALVQTATFENYSEVAALYFHLSWADNQPVVRSEFTNPGVVSFH